MMNKLIYIIIFQIIFICCAIGISNAEEVKTESTQAFSKGSWISTDDYKPGSMQNADQLKNVGNKIIGILQFVGSFVSVIVVIILGIKYMMGSIEEKAEYKKTMWPYLVGALLIFAITNILAVVSSLAEQIGG